MKLYIGFFSLGMEHSELCGLQSVLLNCAAELFEPTIVRHIDWQFMCLPEI